MKKIAVIGVGLGEETLTTEGKSAIRQADFLLGAPRLLALYDGLEIPSRPYYLPKDVRKVVANEAGENFVVLVSGDVGFYSAAASLAEELGDYDLRFIPGVSTVNAFFARLKLPWQGAKFVSLHGRQTNIVDTIRRNPLTFCLTGNNLAEIGQQLCKNGFGKIKTYIGENLGTEKEKIYETRGEDLAKKEFPSLTVLLFINEAADDRILSGLNDNLFLRSPGIPMTKSEIRAIVLSKLHLSPDAICWDVGAGTGSVTVEMALSAYRGHVYGIERKEEAIPLIEKNCASFQLGNVTVLTGNAQEIAATLPKADAVFIGGSGGELEAIIKLALNKNPKVRIVVTAVTIETVSAAVTIFSKLGLEIEIVQLSVAKGKEVGGLHLMEARNPVTIISAGGMP